MIHLDNRLQTIADLLGSVNTLYDIGANHGLLSAYMLQSGFCKYAFITDISPAALKRAQYNLSRTGLLSLAEFIVTDGLDTLTPQPGDGIVISGMGTQVISDILSRSITQVPFVLQPNLDAPELRRYLFSHGYVIEKERICRAAGRFYVCLRTHYSGEISSPSEKDLWIGLLEQDPLFLPYVSWRKKVLEKALAGARRGNDASALKPLEAELNIYHAGDNQC